MRREHLVARFDGTSTATLDELVPSRYDVAGDTGLPPYVRAASALRQFDRRLVIVQDDVNALAVRDASGVLRPVLLPPHASGERVFDDSRGNKHHKLDLEACVTLPDGRLVAFGSGSPRAREQLVLWNGREPPLLIPATPLYDALRAALTRGSARLNVEGAVVRGARLEIFHRDNGARDASRAPSNAIAEIALDEFAAWLDGDRAASPDVAHVMTVDVDQVDGIPFGFTDAVALDAERIVVLACAEAAACAISDGPVLGCRAGLLGGDGLRMVDVCDAAGTRTRLKLEGIERRAGSSYEFDVVVDIDVPSVPAELGRLVWDWR